RIRGRSQRTPPGMSLACSHSLYRARSARTLDQPESLEMSTEQLLAVAPPLSARGSGRPPGRGHLRRTDFRWALAFVAPYGGLLYLRRLPLRICAVDGEQALTLRRPDCRSALPANGHQYFALCWPRRERNDVLGLAAVRLLPAPALVDKGTAGRLCPSLGAGDGASLHLLPLDADRRTGLGRWPIVVAFRHRRS